MTIVRVQEYVRDPTSSDSSDNQDSPRVRAQPSDGYNEIVVDVPNRGTGNTASNSSQSPLLPRVIERRKVGNTTTRHGGLWLGIQQIFVDLFLPIGYPQAVDSS